MKKTKAWLSLALAVTMLLSFAACSRGAASSEAPSVDMAEYDTPAGGEFNSYMDAESLYEQEISPEKEFVTGSGAAEDISNSVAMSPDKIIYSGEAEIETLTFDETIEKIGAMMETYGGFLQSSSVTGRDFYSSASDFQGGRRAYYQIRIPSDKFFTLTGQLETLGNVPYSSTNADNISAQYRDTEARLVAYRAQEARYLELLNMAENVEEVLYVEQYLSQVRYEIERLESQIRNWDASVSYSTLSLTITEVAVYTDEPIDFDAPTYGEQLAATFNKSMKELGSFFKGLLRFIVGAAPALVVLAIIAVPVILIVRARNKKNAAKKENSTGYPPKNQE